MSFLYNTLSDALDEQLETDHLILRPYSEGDENDFMRLLQENVSYLNPAFSGRLARVHALEDARSQIRQLRSDWDNRKTFDFGVWQKEKQTYIGDIALKNLDRSIPKAELGLYFTDWPESEQLAREALQAVVHFAFERLNMNKVYMRCTSANESFGEMARHCGFLKEGTLRSDYRGVDSDELLDLSYYGFTRQDYEQAWQPAGQENSTAVA